MNTEIKNIENRDFELDWIYAQYEDGLSVAAIAKELGKSESYIYAHMKRRPQAYDDVKKIREEIYNRIIRRVRGDTRCYFTSIAFATSAVFSLPKSSSASLRLNSKAVPGPWLVIQLPSTTTFWSHRAANSMLGAG